MKIHLIYPSLSFTPRGGRMRRKRVGFFPPLNLAYLAALVPPDYDVFLTDENNAVVDYDRPADLVGITAMTSTAPRMYEIAAEYRRRGVPVVLGGVHVTALPSEAMEHADAIVLGESDETFPQLLRDFEAGRMKEVYSPAQKPPLENLPMPRRELLKPRGYYYPNTLQTTRGCPFNCSFCTVTKFSGNTYRHRPVSEVIKEISTLKGWHNVVGFTDDNIMGNSARAREFFKELKNGPRIYWGGQVTITAARDEEMLALAYESGCRAVFIGMESVSKETLASVNKKFNKPELYEEAVNTFHRHGIRVLGSFVFGFDTDDPAVFETTVNFAIRMKLELAQFSVLTPFPGTDTFNQLEAEGRLLHKDWSRYYQGDVVFKPKNMSAEVLLAGQKWAWKRFYRSSSIVRRTIRAGRWFPLVYLANKFFSTINFHDVNPLIEYVQRGWSFFDRTTRDLNSLDR